MRRDTASMSGARRPCWMCVYNTNEVAQSVSTLIVEHVHSMNVDTISEQVSTIIETEIRSKYGDDVALEGCSPGDIRRHITEHMLHANVTLAVTLRRLLELSDQLRSQVHTVDEETGQTVVDAAHMRNYLAVTSQITNLH